MRKITAGIVCVLLAVIIAVVSVGCSKGEELTYTGEYQSGSSENQSTVSELPSQVVTIPDSTLGNADTVVYELTTQQGETAQVITPTEPITTPPTMDYNPVTVPTMPTEYISTTSPYVAPTYSGSEPGQVTTKPASQQATEGTTEVKIRYVNVASMDTTGAINQNEGTIDCYIVEGSAEPFAKNVKKGSGKATVNSSNGTYQVNFKVVKEVDNEVKFVLDLPSKLSDDVSTGAVTTISVSFPKGAIIAGNNVSNKAFSTISFS